MRSHSVDAMAGGHAARVNLVAANAQHVRICEALSSSRRRGFACAVMADAVAAASPALTRELVLGWAPRIPWDSYTG